MISEYVITPKRRVFGVKKSDTKKIHCLLFAKPVNHHCFIYFCNQKSRIYNSEAKIKINAINKIILIKTTKGMKNFRIYQIP